MPWGGGGDNIAESCKSFVNWNHQIKELCEYQPIHFGVKHESNIGSDSNNSNSNDIHSDHDNSNDDNEKYKRQQIMETT